MQNDLIVKILLVDDAKSGADILNQIQKIDKSSKEHLSKKNRTFF